MDIAGKILVGVLCAVWIALPIHYNVMKHLARKKSLNACKSGVKTFFVISTMKKIGERKKPLDFIQREQFRKLDQAIMLINSLGGNNNIPE